jgi:hypothetical protein
MPRRGSKQPYKARNEYMYTIKDIAELAGITRNALNVEKVRGKIDPADLKSVVTFLIRKVIGKRLWEDLFPARARIRKRVERRKIGIRALGRKTQKAARRK